MAAVSASRLILAAAGAALLCLSSSPALALQPTSGLGEAGDMSENSVTAEVTTNLRPSLTPGDSLALGVSLESQMEDLGNVTLGLAITTEPLADASAIDSFLADPLAAQVRSLASAIPNAVVDGVAQQPGLLPAGVPVSAVLAATPDAIALPAESWGVYGLVITARSGDSVIWTAPAVQLWEAGVVPSIDLVFVATVSGNDERTAALLEAASDPRVTVLVDPSSVTAEQLDDLASQEAFSLPAGNLDVTTAAHAGTSLLLEDALALSREYSDLPWIALPAALDHASVDAVADAGATAVMSVPKWTGSTGPTAGAVTVTTPSGEIPLVGADPRLSTVFASLSPHGFDSAARLVAETALVAGASSGQSVIVAPGDGWIIDGGEPSAIIEAVLAAPFVEPTTVAEVLSAPDRVVLELPELSPTVEDPATDVAVAVHTKLAALSALGSTTAGRSALIADARYGLLSSMALPARADLEARRLSVDAALADAEKLLDAVAVTSGSELNLISATGDVPITIRNDLDVPVTVTVAMTARSPIIRVEAQPSVTIEPGQEATVSVPVRAISSGDVQVAVALRSADGVTVSLADTLTVRVRAEWGGAATGVLTVGLVGLLLAGVWRTVRRGRKDTRILPDAASDVAGANPADS